MARENSSNVGCPAPPMASKSMTKVLMRSSSLAAWIASVKSRSKVSSRPAPRASAKARCRGSPLTCSTMAPSGRNTSAASSGMTGIEPRIAPIKTPKSPTNNNKCSVLRRPSRPAPKIFKSLRMIYPLEIASTPQSRLIISTRNLNSMMSLASSMNDTNDR